VAALTPNPLNPRGPVAPEDVEDLAASIRAQGILQPLLVTPDGVVVAGHRRLAAARLAGLDAVPAIARPVGEREQLELMLVENLQRRALSPLQEARAFRRLLDAGLTQADVARRVGVPAATVHERLLILRLVPEAQALYGRNALPVTAARVLASVGDPDRQRRVAALAATRGLTVPALEARGRRGQAAAARAPRPTPPAAPAREPGPARAAAVALLVREPGRQVTFGRLFAAIGATCCACGAEAVAPELCRECPLPKFVTLLALPPGALRAALGRAGARAGDRR
jgi:ParB family chromosome partitioning protein